MDGFPTLMATADGGLVVHAFQVLSDALRALGRRDRGLSEPRWALHITHIACVCVYIAEHRCADTIGHAAQSDVLSPDENRTRTNLSCSPRQGCSPIATGTCMLT